MKYINFETGTTDGIIFLLPTLCTDIDEQSLNICLAFLGWQITINFEGK
jgi:hypothetical protein